VATVQIGQNRPLLNPNPATRGQNRPVPCCERRPIQRPIAKYVGIALAALRKVDDSLGDNCVGMIAPLSLKGYASHFKCDPHDPLGLRIGIVAI
jgi:hypothetical protein